MKIRRRILTSLTVFIFISGSSSFAQTKLSDFLLTAYEDRNLLGFDRSIEFLKAKNYSIPPIDELEFRFGNDELTNEDQQYAIRVRPSNPWRVRRNNALFNATKTELTFRRKVQYEENLFRRYELALDYIISEEKSKLAQQRSSLIAQKVEILETNMESNLFDARDLVDEKLRQIDALNDQIEINNRQYGYYDQITLILNIPEFDWSDFELITHQTIDRISAEIAARNLTSTELELITQQIDVANKEIRLEKSDFDFGFFQTEYFPFRDRNSDIGFAFGVNIPLFRNNKAQIAERKLDKIELENEYIAEQFEDSVGRIIEYEKLKRLLQQHEALEQQIEALDVNTLYSGLTNIENNDPLVLLDLKEGILKLDQIRTASKQMLLEQYLEFLNAFSALGKKPLINYLSDKLESIE